MSFYQQEFSSLLLSIKNKNQLWITLNNPKQMNAITTSMIESLVTVLKFADFDRNIRVMVISGEGRSFSAGGDILAMEKKSGMFAGDANELRMRYMHGIQQIPRVMEEISTPVIAMVNGAAVGAGCDLSMMCDLRVGCHASRFAESFSRLGLVPGDGGTFFLQRVIGYPKAMRMFLTAEMLEGLKAYEFGLLDFFVEDHLLIKEAEILAEKIASNGPIAQSMVKKAMKISYQHDLHTSLDILAAYQAMAQRTNDHFEALAAFKEKREPQFFSE